MGLVAREPQLLTVVSVNKQLELARAELRTHRRGRQLPHPVERHQHLHGVVIMVLPCIIVDGLEAGNVRAEGRLLHIEAQSARRSSHLDLFPRGWRWGTARLRLRDQGLLAPVVGVVIGELAPLFPARRKSARFRPLWQGSQVEVVVLPSVDRDRRSVRDGATVLVPEAAIAVLHGIVRELRRELLDEGLLHGAELRVSRPRDLHGQRKGRQPLHIKVRVDLARHDPSVPPGPGTGLGLGGPCHQCPRPGTPVPPP
mmetsp:Transcript_133751/g.298379  ORF Transcript_133751/g.298379 Transcript_133751/m.298379 type:complete len:256 (+) Transcript_133751:231-998(+)